MRSGFRQTRSIRTLIVEDEPLARRTLREILADVPWLECIGEAENGARAVEMIHDLTPDLVLLDIEMPELTDFRCSIASATSPWSSSRPRTIGML
jgi:chemotaxis response regulator CheB